MLKCRVCGAEVAADAPSGQCPKCLLQLGVTGATKESAPAVDDSAQLKAGGNYGDYQLLEMIGRGGMGVVYKARQKSLNRLVALKMVINWRDASETTLARFRLEAEAAAKLDHPNIVPTYQIGEENGQPFFTMKLITGVSLAQKRSELALVSPDGKGAKAPPRSGREAQVRIATLVATVAQAVHYAHQHGVIHRDLKPNNILIDADGEAHLTDFGIAKVLEQDSGLTRTNDVLGAPAYMAPEQASGKAVSTAVDVYGLGAILYELLTGRPPFRGHTPLETLRKVAEEEPVPPTTRNANANVELACICLKCLEKDPMQRYGSALALAEDLERWVRGEPILARHAGPISRMVRWTRRNPVGASLILTLCAGLVGTLVMLKVNKDETEKTRKALVEVNQAGETNAALVVQLREMLETELEGLWLSNERRWIEITSEQLKALDAQPLNRVPKGAASERYTFGLSANESPVTDARRYALLLSELEHRLSARRGRPVRFDLYIFKFKEDRLQALVTATNWLDKTKSNRLDFARMGSFVYLRAKQEHPGIQALVEPESATVDATFFTRPGTGIRTLADMKGRTLAFGDWAESITVWAQDRLKAAGISGRDLGSYVSFDSRSEFITEVHELGFEAAVKRRQWLHNTADVIEAVLEGRFDVGMTTMRGFGANKQRGPGLLKIPGSEFTLTQSPWVARENLPADLLRDFVAVMTSLGGDASLTQLPGKPTGFKAVTEATHAPDRAALQRIEGLFPVPPASRSWTNLPPAEGQPGAYTNRFVPRKNALPILLQPGK